MFAGDWFCFQASYSIRTSAVSVCVFYAKNVFDCTFCTCSGKYAGVVTSSGFLGTQHWGGIHDLRESDQQLSSDVDELSVRMAAPMSGARPYLIRISETSGYSYDSIRTGFADDLVDSEVISTDRHEFIHDGVSGGLYLCAVSAFYA